MITNVGGKSLPFRSMIVPGPSAEQDLKMYLLTLITPIPLTANVCSPQLVKDRQLLTHGLQYCWLWWSRYFFVERDQKNLKRTEKLLGFFQAWKKPDDCMLCLLYS